MFGGFYNNGPFGGGGGGLYPRAPWANGGNGMEEFDEYYRCYSVAHMPGEFRENVNYGGKIILPPSALDKLTRLNISYPMLFELTNEQKGKVTHAGVLEFIADEGIAYLPAWIMKTLKLGHGDMIQCKSTELPQGQFVQIQPQSTDFLDITDPKAVLENALRNYSTLTKDDIFQLFYNNRVYEILVLKVRPDIENDAISVIETDLEVDFAAPKGYVEPVPQKAKPADINTAGSMAKAIGYDTISKAPSTSETSFASVGYTLNGRTPSVSTTTENEEKAMASTGNTQPMPFKLPFGKLFFGFAYVPPPPPPANDEKEGEAKDEAASSEKHHFAGKGQVLKKPRKRKANPAETTTSGNDPEVIEID